MQSQYTTEQLKELQQRKLEQIEKREKELRLIQENHLRNILKPSIEKNSNPITSFELTTKFTEDFVFSNSKLTVEKSLKSTKKWSNAYVYGSQTIPINNIFYYEVTIDEINEKDLTGLVVGLSMDNSSRQTYGIDLAVGMKGYVYGIRTDNLSPFQKGDSIGFLVDRKITNSLYIFKNGKSLDIFGYLPQKEKLWPVFHFHYPGDKVSVKFPKEVPKIPLHILIPSKNITSEKIPSNVRGLETFSFKKNKYNEHLFTLSNDGKTVSKVISTNSWVGCGIYGEKEIPTGKVTYWEIIPEVSHVDKSGISVGISDNCEGSSILANEINIGLTGVIYGAPGKVVSPFHIGDRIGVFVDRIANEVSFYRNGMYLNISQYISPEKKYWPALHLFYTGSKVSLRLPTKYPSAYHIVHEKKDVPFNWESENTKTVLSNFTLKNNGCTLIKTGGINGWKDSTLYGKKVKLDEVSYTSVSLDFVPADKTGVVIGYLSNENKENPRVEDFKNTPGLSLQGHVFGTLSGKPLSYKQGDVVGILIDRKVHKAYYFRNGRYHNISGLLPDDKDYDIYPSFHIFYKNTTLTLRFDEAPKSVPVGCKNEVVPFEWKANSLIYGFSETKTSVRKLGGANDWDSSVHGNKELAIGKKHYWEITVDVNHEKDLTGLAGGISLEEKKGGIEKDIALGMKCYNYGDLKGKSDEIITTGEKLGILVDRVNHKIHFFKNGNDLGIYKEISPKDTYYPVLHMYYIGIQVTVTFPSSIPPLLY